MPLHDKAFWFICFFLIGVLLASGIYAWENKWIVSIGVGFFVALLFLVMYLRMQKSFFAWLALFSIAIVLGSGYYFEYTARAEQTLFPQGKASFSGVIIDVSHGFIAQDLTVFLDSPYQGKIRTATARYPAWEYGDRVSIEGVVKPPSDLQKNFLIKDNIFGVVSFPKIELLEKNQASKIKYALFKVKYFAEKSFAQSFPPQEAAFMSGLTLGETAEFSKEFRDKMKITGTTHLVALSGYNITIIAASVMTMLGAFGAGRRSRFIGSTAAIMAFVLMTGAEASVVRAAIMGFIGLLAGQVSRNYSFRNAIAVAAFAMVIVNPKVLVWDIGFELSFLALLGLVYVRPALMNFFRIRGGAGFLQWRENLFTTLAAQIAVLPLLLARFGTFSVLSIVTNVLILAFVPLTMSVGFLVVGISLVSPFTARLVGFVGAILMRYELGVIDFFSRFDRASLSFDAMNIWLSLLYYIGLIAFVAWVSKVKEKHASIAFT